MKGLAEEGHEVTVISPFKQNKPIDNYKEVFLEHSWEISRKSNWNILKLIFAELCIDKFALFCFS